MKYNTNVKHTTLEAFVTTVNDLGIELIINEALREVRKRQLIELIDDSSIKMKQHLINIRQNTKIWRHFSVNNIDSNSITQS